LKGESAYADLATSTRRVVAERSIVVFLIVTTRPPRTAGSTAKATWSDWPAGA
jgi:hypothetical protein